MPENTGGKVTEFDSLRLEGFADIGASLTVGGDITLVGKLTLGTTTAERIAQALKTDDAESSLPTSRAVLDYIDQGLDALRAALNAKAERQGAPDTPFHTGDLSVSGKITLGGVEVAQVASSLEGAAETAVPTVGAVTLYVEQQSAALGKHLTAVEETVAAIPRIEPERVDELSSRLDILEKRIAELGDMFDRLVKDSADGMRQLEERVEELAKEVQSKPLPPEKVSCPTCGEDLEVPAKMTGMVQIFCKNGHKVRVTRRSGVLTASYGGLG